MLKETYEQVINHLIQLDIDSSFAYKAAIEAVKIQEIKQQLTHYHDDYTLHVEQLSSILEEMGVKPIHKSLDFKELLTEGLIKLKTVLGANKSLKEILKNEAVLQRAYAEALAHSEFSEKIRKVLMSNYQDEKRHCAYIEEKLNQLEGIIQ